MHLESPNYQGEKGRFSIKIGLALLAVDCTTCEQGAASHQQMDPRADDLEVRSLRLMARGHRELCRRWNYLLSYECNGFDRDAKEPYWSSTDVRISTDVDGWSLHRGTPSIRPQGSLRAAHPAAGPQGRRAAGPQGHWGASEIVGRYGRVDLDRFALTGNTQTFLTRLQWIH